MKKVILVSTFIIFTSVLAIAQEKAKEEGENTYTVKTGDTLWDLSGEFLKDPFKWPNIWEQNPDIENPHLIYPGQRILIRPLVEKVEEKPAPPPVPEPPKEAAKVEEAPPPPAKEEVPEVSPPPVPQAPPKKTLLYPGIETISFIDTITPMGKIMGSKEDRVMLSYGDEVYLDMGEGRNIKEGERYTIYRRPIPIYHPLNKKKLLGYQVTIMGIVEIEKVHEKLSIGRIVASYDAISKGDSITTKLEPTNAEIEPKKAEVTIEGIIVANGRGSVEIAQGDLVFLDMGRGKGVEVGNSFTVYLPERTIGEYIIPAEEVGRLLVLSIQEETSTALVMKSNKPLHIGNKVRMEKGI